MYAIRSYYEDEGGNPSHTELRCDVRAVVHVQLRHPHPSLELLRHLFENGRDDLARAAPGGRITSYNVCYTKLLRSVRVAGDKVDEAILQYVKRKYNLLIGDPTAEYIKVTVGNAFPGYEDTVEVKGLDMVSGVPKALIP